MSKFSERDDKTIARLLRKYGAEALIQRVQAPTATRDAGRPADPPGNLVAVWAHVEHRRDRGDGPRRKIDRGCDLLSRDLTRFTTDRKITKPTVRGIYYAAVKAFRANAAMKLAAEKTLARLREAVARGALGPLVPLLFRFDGKGWVSCIIDLQQFANKSLLENSAPIFSTKPPSYDSTRRKE